MNKGMIIFDKPNRCEECPCYYISPVISGRMCQITGDYISPNKPIPDRCALLYLWIRNRWILYWQHCEKK